MRSRETWIEGILFYKPREFTRSELEAESRINLREVARLLGIDLDIQERAFLTSSLAQPFDDPRPNETLVSDCVDRGIDFNEFNPE